MQSVSVVFSDGMMDLVDPKSLQVLIETDAIVKFHRADGWVYLGLDPVRSSERDNYQGPERRLSS
jgi:hypothetical protein